MRHLKYWILAVCSIWLTMGAYPPGQATISTNPPSVGAGATFSATACGFTPGETITFTINGESAGSGVAGADGCAIVTLIAPAQPGTHALVATGHTSGIIASGSFIALASESPVATSSPPSTAARRREGLATTGQSIGTTVRAGAALVIVGVGAIVLTTQRHRSARPVDRRR